MSKATCKSFPIDVFINQLEKCYLYWDSPASSLMAKVEKNPFRVLISAILSSRTKDKVTNFVAEKLFNLAGNPEKVLTLTYDQIKHVIYPVGFYRIKASRIIDVCNILVKKYAGVVPDKIEMLLDLPGVGRKTANLVLSEGFDIPSICVDTHVHRISNRIGYVKTKSVYETEFVLREQLPKKYWKDYNRLIVSLGQVICRPVSPICSRCPVVFMCPRLAMKKFR